MAHPEDSGGVAALSRTHVKDTIKRIHEYVWARHIDGSDHYDHSISEEEALRMLNEHYAEMANRSSPDQVYLGILLFERAFEDDEKQAEYFVRARKIFEFYRRVTGEDDWPAVEDRLEDIEAFFEDEKPAVEPPPPAPPPPAAEPAPEPTAAVAAPVAVAEVPEIAESVVVEPAPAVAEAPVVEEPDVEEPEAAPPPVVERGQREAEDAPRAVHSESAAEVKERAQAEAAAARREAAEAFIADLEVVDGMQLIPAGTFVFGDDGKEVFLDSYYIDRLPVTNAEYMRFVRETGYRSPRYVNDARLNGPSQPVVGIGLSDAQQFAKWAGKDLPTERQWEKAARGTDGRPYPWGNDPPGTSDACFGLDPREGVPQPVGQSLRNVSPFGVQDVCGNIWEWTSSRFIKDGEFRVVRGGSYNDPPEMLALDFRLEAHPKDKSEALGFRCVKNIHH